MSDFASVWDDAGDSAEAQASLRSLAQAKASTQGLWPFLALAQDDVEFGQRLDLAGDRISAAAASTGANPVDLVASFTREFALLSEARALAARSACAHCGHASERHANGASCTTCGCSSFVASGTKAAGRDDSGRFTSADEPDERTSAERYGDVDDSEQDPGDAQADWYRGDYLASLKTALEEGLDPLEWVEQDAAGQGTPEKPGGHTVDNEPMSQTPDPNQAQASLRQTTSDLDHAIQTARSHIPVQQRIVAPEHQSGYTIVTGDDGLHHVYNDNAWQQPSEQPMLPWHPPSGTPVARVGLDGTVTHLPPAQSARSLGRSAKWFSKDQPQQQRSAPSAPKVDPLAGRPACPNCGTNQTAPMPQAGLHKCWQCSGVFRHQAAVKRPF